jgi:cell division protease FtsH
MTTGAELDVQQLTEIAREMVGRWGMSERIGPVAVMPDDGSPLLHPVVRSRSEDTQRTIDREVHRLVDEAHRDVTRLLTEHRSQLHALAEALLQAA